MMIHQYRHALRQAALGAARRACSTSRARTPSTTASRELAEEAGLAAAEWSVLLDVAPSPGFSDESVRVFLARGLTDVEPPGARATTRRRT